MTLRKTPGLVNSLTATILSATPNVMSGYFSALIHPAVRQVLRLIMSITKMNGTINAITQRNLKKSTSNEAFPSTDKNDLSNIIERKTSTKSPKYASRKTTITRHNVPHQP